MNHDALSGRSLVSACAVMLFFLLLLFSVMSLPAFARTADTPYGAVTVTAEAVSKKEGEIIVTAACDDAFVRAKKGETLYLFAVRPYETADHLRTMSPAATASVSKSVEFRIPDVPDRRNTGYLVALGVGADYEVLCEPVYLSNPGIFAGNTAPRVPSPSIKGLTVSGTLLSDAQNLGISHAVIPISIDRFLTKNPAGETFSVLAGGGSTFFDPDSILKLDQEVKLLSNAGIHISFRFLLDGSSLKTDTAAACLYAEGAEPGASLYGISVSEKKAYQTACGLFAYFAERYASAPDRPPVDFILGYQVNEYDRWNRTVPCTMEEAARTYADVFRIADAALRSVSANSRVYIPLSNLFVSARPYLYAFADDMDGAAWGVGIAPYASDPLSDTIWNDAAKDDFSTSHITTANLAVLKQLLSEPEFLFEDAVRPVIIDDFGVQGTSGDDASQIRQAASLACAYYQAVSSEFIEAFYYHRIHDGSDEGSSYGLRALDDAKKPAYEVFRLMDTQAGTPLLRDYLAVIGEKSWGKIVGGFSKKKAEPVRLYEASAVEDPEAFLKRYAPTPLFTFTGESLHGFFPGTHAAAVDMVTPSPADGPVGTSAGGESAGTPKKPALNSRVLKTELYPMPGYESGGVCAQIEDPTLLSKARGISLSLCAQAPDGVGSVHVTLRLGRMTDGKKMLYSASADLPAGHYTNVIFPTGDFIAQAGGADSMEILISEIGAPSQAEPAEGMVLYINDVTMYEGGSLLGVVMLWIVGILLFLVLLFTLLVIRASIIRKKKRRLAAARRRKMQASAGRNPQRPQVRADPARTRNQPRPPQQAVRRPPMHSSDEFHRRG